MSDGVDTHGVPPAADEADDVAVVPRRSRTALVVAVAVGAVLALLLVALAATSDGPNDTADTPLLGTPAPLVQTTTLDGSTFDLSTRRGSWVVLNFFATWCPPCKQEHPELVKFAMGQAAQPDGAELVTVVNNDDPENVRAWFEENGGDWPVLTDPGGRVYVSFGVAKVPETWIVDPDGIIRARIITTVTAEGLAEVLARTKAGEER
jgi:cytochrome c biogenesis protein CcmG/thiol:disulfide interchange protein DsbE